MIPVYPRNLDEINNYCQLINKMINELDDEIQSDKIKGVLDNEIRRQRLDTISCCRAANIVCSLNIMRYSNSELFTNQDIQKLVEKINKIFIENNVDCPIKEIKSYKSEEYYKINRSIKEFTGNKLVVGCGHAMNEGVKQCDGHSFETTYLIDINKNSKPDMEANVYSNECWKQFDAERFEEVFFEGFPPRLDEKMLKNILRILMVGGKLRLPVSSEYEGKDEKYFQSLGFAKAEMVSETYFSCTKRRASDMLHLYK